MALAAPLLTGSSKRRGARQEAGKARDEAGNLRKQLIEASKKIQEDNEVIAQLNQQREINDVSSRKKEEKSEEESRDEVNGREQGERNSIVVGRNLITVQVEEQVKRRSVVGDEDEERIMLDAKWE